MCKYGKNREFKGLSIVGGPYPPIQGISTLLEKLLTFDVFREDFNKLHHSLKFVEVKGKTSTTQKMKFPWRISSVNVAKSAGNYGFGLIYWRKP